METEEKVDWEALWAAGGEGKHVMFELALEKLVPLYFASFRFYDDI